MCIILDLKCKIRVRFNFPNFRYVAFKFIKEYSDIYCSTFLKDCNLS